MSSVISQNNWRKIDDSVLRRKLDFKENLVVKKAHALQEAQESLEAASRSIK